MNNILNLRVENLYTYGDDYYSNTCHIDLTHYGVIRIRHLFPDNFGILKVILHNIEYTGNPGSIRITLNVDDANLNSDIFTMSDNIDITSIFNVADLCSYSEFKLVFEYINTNVTIYKRFYCEIESNVLPGQADFRDVQLEKYIKEPYEIVGYIESETPITNSSIFISNTEYQFTIFENVLQVPTYKYLFRYSSKSKIPGMFDVILSFTNSFGTINRVYNNYLIVYDKPIVNFRYDIISEVSYGSNIITVKFTDLSTNKPTKWEWDFGDGTTSNGQNPIHKYLSNKPREYTVKLRTSNPSGYGKTLTRKKCIVYNLPPMPNFIASYASLDHSLPVTINFLDKSTNNPTYWEWDFGDGVKSYEQNPQHTYEASLFGSFNVKLTVSNSLNTMYSIVKDGIISIEWDLKCDFDTSVKSGSSPLSINFINLCDLKTDSYLWDFGDGTTSTDPNPLHIYFSEDSKMYDVSLTITAKRQFKKITKPRFISLEVPTVANFETNTLYGDSPLIVDFYDLTNNNPKRWIWDFGDGHSSSEQNPTHQYETNIPTSYTVKLTVWDYNNDQYEYTREKLIYVGYNISEVIFRSDVLFGYAPLVVNFSVLTQLTIDSIEWNFGNNIFSNEENPTHVYNFDHSRYSPSVLVNNEYLFVSRHHISIDYDHSIDFKYTIDVQEDSYLLTFTPITNTILIYHQWIFDDMVLYDFQPIRKFILTESIQFELKLSVIFIDGFKTNINKLVSIDVPLNISISCNKVLGYKTLLSTFTNTTKGHIKGQTWNFGDGNISYDVNPTHLYKETELDIKYDVTLTCIDHNGESHTKLFPKFITLKSKPIADFTSNIVSGFSPLTVQFKVEVINEAELFIWDFGDGAISYDENPIHTYYSKESRCYNVKLQCRNRAGKCEVIKSNYILINLRSTSNFNLESISSFTASFKSLSDAYPNSYLWDFGDGKFSNDTNPSHTYLEEGLYTVTLTTANKHAIGTTKKKTYNISQDYFEIIDTCFQDFIDLSNDIYSFLVSKSLIENSLEENDIFNKWLLDAIINDYNIYSITCYSDYELLPISDSIFLMRNICYHSCDISQKIQYCLTHSVFCVTTDDETVNDAFILYKSEYINLLNLYCGDCYERYL